MDTSRLSRLFSLSMFAKLRGMTTSSGQDLQESVQKQGGGRDR